MTQKLLFISLTTALLASSQSDYQYLDRLAVEAQTDKGSTDHNYTEIYAEYFAPLREKPLKFLEIGIGGGASVLLWDRYFPNAELHFIDNEPLLISQSKPARAHFHLVDQSEADELQAFGAEVGGNFDIIIDDGGHFMDQQIISLQTLFPYLKSGGLYIIEDLHTSYWTWFGGNGNTTTPKAGPGTTIEFLKQLVEDLNYVSSMTGYGDWKRTVPGVQTTEFQKNIHSIYFYRSLCIIKKL